MAEASVRRLRLTFDVLRTDDPIASQRVCGRAYAWGLQCLARMTTSASSNTSIGCQQRAIRRLQTTLGAWVRIESVRHLLLVCCAAGLCGCAGGQSPTSASTTSGSRGLELVVSAGKARISYRPGNVSVVEYSWCYTILLAQKTASPDLLTIRRAENVVNGPDGSVYGTSTDFERGIRLGGSGSSGLFGCPPTYEDPDATRPVATTYRMTVYYTWDSGSPPGTFSVTSTGSIENTVPPPPTRPQMTGLTLTHDIPGGQRIIRNRAPATFVAAGQGGVPPYEYRWKINGILVRDWSASAPFKWDATINGQPIFPGGYKVVVEARGFGGTEPEYSAGLDVIVLD